MRWQTHVRIGGWLGLELEEGEQQVILGACPGSIEFRLDSRTIRLSSKDGTPGIGGKMDIKTGDMLGLEFGEGEW